MSRSLATEAERLGELLQELVTKTAQAEQAHTTLEHQLFAAEPNPPEIPENFGKKAAQGGSYAQFPRSKSLDPTGKPLTVEASKLSI